MNLRSIADNALVAFAAQGISLLASLAMSLVVPKALGVAEFGYWQLFVFYASYSGLFHFGLDDGVYLLEGGKTRDQIDKPRINSQFLIGVLVQLIVVVCVLFFAKSSSMPSQRTFVLYAFAFYTAELNLSAFFGYVFQAMNETKLFSSMTIIERMSFLIITLLLVFSGAKSFEGFVIAYVASRGLSLVFSLWHARDFLASGWLGLDESLRSAIISMKVGIGLMLANVADMLILGVGRFLVDAEWGIEAFGEVSLVLSMVNFFITFVAQGSMVLFPALRQGSESERREFYRASRDIMELAFPLAYLAYFPLVALLVWWLPQYAGSMRYLALLLPVCVFNSKMDLCCATYMKVLRMERTLLIVNVATVGASMTLAVIGVYMLGSLEAVLVGAVIAIVCRSLWCERVLNKELGVNDSPMAVEEILLTGIFMICAIVLGGWLGICAYGCCYALYLALNMNRLHELLSKTTRLVNRH